MTRRKPCEVRKLMLEPTWAATNNPQAAPAIARPMRSNTWANLRTRNRMAPPIDRRRQQVRPFLPSAKWPYTTVNAQGVADPAGGKTRLPPDLGHIADAGRGCAGRRGAALLPRAEGGRAEQVLLLMGRGAPIGRRRRDMAAELGGGVPAPARVVEHATRERDHIGLARSHDLFGLSRLRDQADRDGADARLLPDRLRERHLVAGRERDLLVRRYAAGGGIDPITAALFQFPNKGDGLPEVPAALDPIGRRHLD